MDREKNVSHASKLAILMTISALAGCQPAADISTCTDQLSAKLKSPSSLKIVDKYSYGEKIAAATAIQKYTIPEDFAKSNGDREILIKHVRIEYDAENSYGAALRDTEFCSLVSTPSGLVPVEFTHQYIEKTSASALADSAEIGPVEAAAMKEMEKIESGQ